jgi:hypothetical protein
MAGIRQARAFLTSLWLVMQAALLISSSVVLLTASHEETATECTCMHGEHAICPMHHRPTPGSKICLIGSTDDTLATLGSLFQAVGLMPSVTSAPAPAVIAAASISLTSSITVRSVPPDPPPPRA